MMKQINLCLNKKLLFEEELFKRTKNIFKEKIGTQMKREKIKINIR